jgi:hypothetical protein
MSRPRILVVSLLFFVVLLHARPLLAQTEDEEGKLAAVLYDVFPGDDAPSRGFVGSISSQLSSFPLGSSAGGFTWTFDTGTGAFVRASQSFGPLFAERALTVGRNKLNVGFNYQRATYDEIEELSLRDGDLKRVAQVGSVIATDELSLELNVDTAGFFANYGVTDLLDVGVAIPVVRVKANFARRIRAFTPTGQEIMIDEPVREGRATASGIGDVVVRGKFKLFDQPGGGLALGLDLRLPTGDEEDLLGLPGTQAKLFGIYSTAVGRVAPHVNIGYTFGSSNNKTSTPEAVRLQANAGTVDPFILLSLPDEFNYTGGADFAVHPRVTIVGDIVGRVVRSVLELEQTDSLGLGPQFQGIDINRDNLVNLNLTLASVGVKFNPVSNLLVTFNALFPITKGGLRDKFTPVFGLDWSF